jgi:UDP-N-acetylmuramoyl-tripeptide--D-alanyl-D-alanine ligase
MSALWTGTEAATATGGTLVHSGWEALGVAVDSRSVVPGDLFVALKGCNDNGHDHVATALAAGAVAALVERVPEGLPAGAALLLVKDTLAALGDLGRAARARSTARVIAITGSIGKTGTKEMLRLALAEQGATHACDSSDNSPCDVLLSLSRLPRSARFAIFELGHPGEFTSLTRLVRPHVAIITTVETVHTAHFKTIDDIADAKAGIFLGLEPGGVAVLNRDNRQFRRLAAAAGHAGVETILSFGSHIDASARLLDCGIDPDETAVFALLKDHAIAYRVGVPGLHWAMNSLAVLLAVRSVGGDPDRAAGKLADMTPPKGYGQRHVVRMDHGSYEVIDESYHASPASMTAAIATLAAARPAKGARRIAVLGDMLDLGRDASALHAGLAEAIDSWRTDLVFTIGPLMASLYAAIPEHKRGCHAASAEEAAPLVKAAIRPGDVVMVKGSAGSRMGDVVKTLIEGE